MTQPTRLGELSEAIAELETEIAPESLKLVLNAEKLQRLRPPEALCA